MKKILLVSLFLPFLLSSCGGTSGSSSSRTSTSLSTSKEDKTANIFILIGQSNMEGNTTITNFGNYCNSMGLDKTKYTNGFDNVKISYHNHYDSKTHNYSNETNPDKCLFVPTKLGQGVTKMHFGPELAMAEKFEENVKTMQNPLYFVKYCSGGTGFIPQTRDGNSNWNWQSPSSNSKKPGDIYLGLLNYVNDCIEQVMTDGYEPIIKGILWMQGETDACNINISKNYYSYLSNLVKDLRKEFSIFAKNGDGENIAFIDAYIREDSSVWPYYQDVNGAKFAFEGEKANNYLVDTTSTGLNLTVKSDDGFGGGDQYHYNISSMMKLGKGFADIILENNLLN